MAAVNALMQDAMKVMRLASQAQTIEKARVEAIKSQASNLFEATHREYCRMKTVINSYNMNGCDHAELHICMAEAAFATEHYPTARLIIETFLQLSPQPDQFYCRARLLLGLIIDYEARDSNGLASIQQRKQALAEVITSLSIATAPENIFRYKFMVFNTTVIGWRIMNQFLRTGRAKLFVDEISKFSAALEAMDDPDKTWRIMYLSAAAVCLDDDKQAKAAGDALDKAIELAEGMLSHSSQSEQVTSSEILEISKLSESYMSELRRVEEFELCKTRKKKIDPDEEDETQDVPVIVEESEPAAPLEGMAALGHVALKQLLDAAQQKKAVAEGRYREIFEEMQKCQETVTRLYRLRVHVNPPDSKRISTLPQVTQTVRTKVLVQLQCVCSPGCVAEKDIPAVFAAMVKDLDTDSSTGTSSPSSSSALLVETYLDVSRAAWHLSLRDVAVKCFEAAVSSTALTAITTLKLDICRALQLVADITQFSPHELMSQRLSVKQVEGYGVSKRIEAIKLLERVLTIAMSRIGDNALLQEICVIAWNIIVPLLQPHLRLNAHRILQLVVNALEQVSSSLQLLRAQAHIELGKCEEQADFVMKAKQECDKALACDYGSIEPPVAAVAAAAGPGGPNLGGPNLGGLASTRASALVPNDSSVSRPSTAQTEFLINDTDTKSSIDRNRRFDHLIMPWSEILEYRGNVYHSPSDMEGQVNVMLQQIKESHSKNLQATMLFKAAYLMQEEVKDEIVETSLRKSSTLKRTASSLSLTSKTIVVQTITLDEIERIVNIPREVAVVAPAAGAKVAPGQAPAVTTGGFQYTNHTDLKQKRSSIMATIARMGHANKNIEIFTSAAMYLLKSSWDTKDDFLRGLIDDQIDIHFLMADNIVERISQLWLDPEQESEWNDENAKCNEGAVPAPNALEVGDLKDIPDPRALGYNCRFTTTEMLVHKKLVLLCLTKGIQLAVLQKDEYGIQNGIIYFWNLHLHLFRNNLYTSAMPEVYAFLKFALEVLESFVTSSGGKVALDERLRASLVESLALMHEANGQVAEAIATATKGCVSGSAYVRRRLCELVSRLVAAQSSGAGGGGGGKTPGKPAEMPKFDHPFLNVFAILAQLDMPSCAGEMLASLAEKCIALMTTEVAAYLATMDANNLPQEEYDQLTEMQAQCWTRLTRAKIRCGDIHGAQEMAEKCMNLVAEGILHETDARRLSPRVWRWVSVCERYFGIAISRLIQSNGQDETLQHELQLAALRHFVIACDYAQRARKEDLIVAAAINAWNISRELVDVSSTRESLSKLQRSVVTILLTCDNEQVVVAILRQQFYLAMIDGLTQNYNWDEALTTVFEAFDHVSVSLQKPLWKWRVVVMSKKGKNVLDGLQKLKETDASLQARVYAILARAASNPKQQLDAYAKAIDILHEDIERVEYIVETAQWMSSAGVPRQEIADVLKGGLDALYEVEEVTMIGQEDNNMSGGEGDNASEVSGTSSRSKHSQKSSSRGTLTRKGSIKSSTKGPGSDKALTRAGSSKSMRQRSASKQSVDSMPGGDEGPAGTLNLQQLELAARSLVMLAMLENNSDRRLSLCLEAMFVVTQSINVWSDALQNTTRVATFQRLPSRDRNASAMEIFSVPIVLDYVFPKDLVAWLSWLPSNLFRETMIMASTQSPLQVPGVASIKVLPLTVHYLLWTAGYLDQCGFTQQALWCLGWLRALIMFAKPVTPANISSANTTALLATIHAKTLNIMLAAGLVSEAQSLPPYLGLTSSLTCADFFANYGNQEQASSIRPMPEPAPSEQLSVFGFTTWTCTVDSTGIDTATLMMMACEDLLELGQVALCRSITLAAKRDYQLRCDSRGLLQAITMMARLDQSRGLTKQVVCSAVAAESLLVSCGDARSLSSLTVLAMQAYVHLDQLSDAKQLAEAAIKQLSAAVQQPLAVSIGPSKSRSGTSGVAAGVGGGGSVSKVAGGGSHSSSSSTLIKASSITRGGAGESISSASAGMPCEMSVDNVTALAELVVAYVDVLVAESNRLASMGKDIYSIYQDVINQLNGLIDLVVNVCGYASSLHASLLSKRGIVCFRLLYIINSLVCKSVSMDQYQTWYRTELAACIDSSLEAVVVQKALLMKVPATEQFLRSFNSSTRSSVSNKRIVTSLTRNLGRYEVESCFEQIALATLMGDVTGTPHVHMDSLTVTEQYLKNTELPKAFALPDFVIPTLHNAAQSATDALQMLRSTDYETDGQVLLSACKALMLSGAGAFLGSWASNESGGGMSSPAEPVTTQQTPSATRPQTPQASTVTAASTSTTPSASASATQSTVSAAAAASVTATGATTAETLAAQDQYQLSSDAVTARERLSEATRQAVVSDRTEAVVQGAGVLLELYGSQSPDQAACWLLTMHSCKAKKWLESTWRDSLNPSSEVSSSLRRLNKLLTLRRPTLQAQQQILAEQLFLQSSSVPWRRLNVSADPGAILRSAAVAGSTFVLCVQLCAASNTLYACAGVPSPGGPVAAADSPAWKAPGTWCVDKMILSDESKRALQAMKLTHSNWCSDTVKFVGMYGEGLPQDSDLEGVGVRYADKNIRKTEKLLEERLQALLAELGGAVAQLLGPNSIIDHFIATQLLALSSRPVTSSASAGPPAGKGGKATTAAASHASSHDTPVKPASLLLLVDIDYVTLPWEGLGVVGRFADHLVHRDFSLHLLSHRLASLTASASPAVSDKDKDKALASAVVSVNVASTAVRVIADPNHDDEGHALGTDIARAGILAVCSAMTATPGATSAAATAQAAPLIVPVPGGRKWTKIAEPRNTLSSQDWWGITTDCSPQKPALVFVYAPSRLGSLVCPQEVSAMNWESVAVLLSCDMTFNDASIRRQNSTDNTKSPRDVQKEAPMIMTALASLAGVGAVISHHWGNTFVAQKRFVELFWSNYSKPLTNLLSAGAPAAPVLVAEDTAEDGGAPPTSARPDKHDKPSGGHHSSHHHSQSHGHHQTAAAPVVKKWLRLSRLHFGLANVYYLDGESK